MNNYTVRQGEMFTPSGPETTDQAIEQKVFEYLQ